MNLDINVLLLLNKMSLLFQYSFIFIWVLTILFYIIKFFWIVRRINSLYSSIKYLLIQKFLLPILLSIYSIISFYKIDLSPLYLLSLSTREYAIFTWLLISIIVSLLLLWKQRNLHLLYTVLKQVSSPKILIPTLLYFIWFILGVLILSYIGLWDLSYLKTSILWFLFEALVIFYSIEKFKKAKKLKFQVEKFISKSLSISTLLAIFTNLYTFNYFVELILIFFLFIISLLIIFIKHVKKDTTMLLGCFEIFLGLSGFLLLLFSLINFITVFELSKLTEILIEYFLLILLSIWVIPAVYTLRIFALYELIWIKLNSLKYIPNKMKKLIQLAVIKNCHLNFYRLEKFYRDPNWKTMKFDSRTDITKYFLLFNRQLK